MSSPPNVKLPQQSPEDVQETAAPATSGAAASSVDAPENAWSIAMPPPWSKTEEASHSASGRSDGVGHENVDGHVFDSVPLRAILEATDFTWLSQTNTGTSFTNKPAPSVASGWSRTTVSSANDMSIKSSSSAQSGSHYGRSMSTQRSRNNTAPPDNSLSSVKEDIIFDLAQRFRQVLEQECPPILGCSTWPEATAELSSSAGTNYTFRVGALDHPYAGRPPYYVETSASGLGVHEHVAAGSGKPCPEASDGSSGAQQQGSQRHSGAAGKSSGSDHARPKRKRNRSSGQADDMSGDEEGEDDGRRKRRKSPAAAEAVPGKPNFACPFYKRLPKVHNKLTSCVFPGFATIARLKEHLYRAHTLSGFRCPVCHEIFEERGVLIEHLTRTTRCAAHDCPPGSESLDADQVNQLKARTRAKGEAGDADKWRKIYRICFRMPEDADTPSPYCEHASADSPDIETLQSYWRWQKDRLPALIDRELRAAFEGEVDVYQVEQRVRSQIPDMLRACQGRLFERYEKEVLSPKTEAGRASAAETGLLAGQAAEGSFVAGSPSADGDDDDDAGSDAASRKAQIRLPAETAAQYPSPSALWPLDPALDTVSTGKSRVDPINTPGSNPLPLWRSHPDPCAIDMPYLAGIGLFGVSSGEAFTFDHLDDAEPFPELHAMDQGIAGAGQQLPQDTWGLNISY